jgi:hypothetical protein
MTSAATKPASGAGGRHAEGRGYGTVMFAALVLALVGVFNLMYGVAAIANSHVLTTNAHFVFGTVRAWGWVTLTLAILQLFAAIGVLLGNQLTRWFGVAVVGLNAIGQMFFIPAYPFWSLMIIAVDVIALYALCAHGGRADADAVWDTSDWGAGAS